MNNKKAKQIQINIDDIHLNVENPRFEKVNSQVEAIHVMLTEFQDKIYNLAKHIVEHGINPTELAAVIKSEDGKYIVLDGNRRLTALKILKNPELIGNDFNKLKTKIVNLDRSRIPLYITAMEFSTEEEANLWINLKHTGENEGVGTVAWNSVQQSRFNNNKYPLSIQFLRYMDGSKVYKSSIAPKIKDLKISNLERLLIDPDVRSALFISKNGNVLMFPLLDASIECIFNNLLKELLEEDFTVRKIFYKVDRSEFMKYFISKYNLSELDIKNLKSQQKTSVKNNIKDSNIIDRSVVTQEEKQTNKANPTSNKSSLNSRVVEMPSTQDRLTLIPSHTNIIINNSKINDIYKELKRISVNDYPNIVGASFRVFLELSIDLYIEQYREEIDTLKNDKLKNKLQKVTEHIKNKLKLQHNELKDIYRAISCNNNIISIDTLHGYIHSTIAQASADGLKTTWNNYEKFFEFLYSILNNNA